MVLGKNFLARGLFLRDSPLPWAIMSSLAILLPLVPPHTSERSAGGEDMTASGPETELRSW